MTSLPGQGFRNGCNLASQMSFAIELRYFQCNLCAFQRSFQTFLSMWSAVENTFLWLIPSVDSRNKLTIIVIPVTVAGKQPSLKHNEM